MLWDGGYGKTLLSAGGAVAQSKNWCVEHPGRYPPALDDVVNKRQAFEQIHGATPAARQPDTSHPARCTLACTPTRRPLSLLSFALLLAACDEIT